MIPFHLIYNYRTAQKTGQWKFLSMQVIPLAVFFASRALPIVVPSQKFSYFATITLWLRQFILMPDKQVSFIVAHFNSLGILTILPFFFLKEMRRFLRMNYEWQYYALITLILSVIGGGDMDRFILWQAPFLITALLAIRNQEENSNRFLWIPLLGIQMIAMELFLPWFPQEPFYVSRYAAYSIRWLKVDMIVFSFFLVVATWRIFINYLSQIEKTSLPIGKVVS